MCVSADLAEFTGTIIYAGRCDHPEHGQIEVFGYQNTAVNFATGPNAMLLHLPAEQIVPEQFLNVGRHTDVLTRMGELFAPAAASASAELDFMDAQPVQVFDHDVYTVVLAANPADIPAALSRVPQNRRPSVRPDLLDFYAATFPRHTIALCCFDNRDAARAAPLLLWYAPLDPDRVVVPGIDSHTGGAPDLTATVARDHLLIYGTDEADGNWGIPVEHDPSMRHKLRAYLPSRITGEWIIGETANGDFAISYADLRAERLDKIAVVTI